MGEQLLVDRLVVEWKDGRHVLPLAKPGGYACSAELFTPINEMEDRQQVLSLESPVDNSRSRATRVIFGDSVEPIFNPSEELAINNKLFKTANGHTATCTLYCPVIPLVPERKSEATDHSHVGLLCSNQQSEDLSTERRIRQWPF